MIKKIKRALKVLKNDDAIIITSKSDLIVVDACNQPPDKVKEIATAFFRQAYNLK